MGIAGRHRYNTDALAGGFFGLMPPLNINTSRFSLQIIFWLLSYWGPAEGWWVVLANGRRDGSHAANAHGVRLLRRCVRAVHALPQRRPSSSRFASSARQMCDV